MRHIRKSVVMPFALAAGIVLSVGAQAQVAGEVEFSQENEFTAR